MISSQHWCKPSQEATWLRDCDVIGTGHSTQAKDSGLRKRIGAVGNRRGGRRQGTGEGLVGGSKGGGGEDLLGVRSGPPRVGYPFFIAAQ